jgi:hypothetical protein
MDIEAFGVAVISERKQYNIPFGWRLGAANGAAPALYSDFSTNMRYFRECDPEYNDIVLNGSISESLVDGDCSSLNHEYNVFFGWLYVHGELSFSIEMHQFKEFNRIVIRNNTSSRFYSSSSPHEDETYREEVRELLYRRFGMRFKNSSSGLVAVVRK